MPWWDRAVPVDQSVISIERAFADAFYLDDVPNDRERIGRALERGWFTHPAVR